MRHFLALFVVSLQGIHGGARIFHFSYCYFVAREMEQEKASSKGSSIISVIPQKKPTSSTSCSQKLSNSGNFTGFYSPIFLRKESLTSEPLSFTPSSCYSDDENEQATENRLYLARITLEYHQMAEKYAISLSNLQEATDENELLQQENARLRLANGDLSKHLNLLTSSGSCANYSPAFLTNGFGSLNIGTACQNRRSSVGDLSETSPTSVFGFQEDTFERTTERCTLPKSISIRSSGFLKMAQGNGSSATASSSRSNRTRVSNPVNVGSVYVPGAKKDEEALELEVYNQGMLKTELCNKWQEIGACPYGNQCQFAHGIGELRPVIRHPRYKTEVCRMVLAGDICPYGHRCHFRHSITDQDRFTSPR